nr:MAG TPA: hypothetical protein [Caudoviricetes sp.]
MPILQARGAAAVSMWNHRTEKILLRTPKCWRHKR